MPDRMYFAKPEYGTVEVGSLVWFFGLSTLLGPFHVVDIRSTGYGNGARKQWILFDSSKNEYYPAAWDALRVPMPCVTEEE